MSKIAGRYTLKINAFCFSKNRACQLHLLLSSFVKNCPHLFKPTILFKSDSSTYADGYTKLSRDPAIAKLNCEWVSEYKPIREHFVDFLNYVRGHNDFFCFFTDDCVFFRKCTVTAQEIINEAFDEKTFCFSFRSGLNTLRQDYINNTWQKPLSNSEIEFSPPFIRWNWFIRPSQENYGYCSGQDGSAYRASDYLELIKDWRFENMRSLEGSLANEPRRSQIKRRFMASFSHSFVLNIPANSMQVNPTASGRIYYSDPAELNERYLNGEVIDLDKINFEGVAGSHEEREYFFKDTSPNGNPTI